MCPRLADRFYLMGVSDDDQPWWASAFLTWRAWSKIIIGDHENDGTVGHEDSARADMYYSSKQYRTPLDFGC